MTDDPNLVPISSPEALYKPLPPGVTQRDYSQRTPEQIGKDLILAHKNIRALEKRDNEKRDTINKLIRQKDDLQKKDLDQQDEIEALQKSQHRTSIWTAVVVASVAPVWGILAKIVYDVLSRHK